MVLPLWSHFTSITTLRPISKCSHNGRQSFNVQLAGRHYSVHNSTILLHPWISILRIQFSPSLLPQYNVPWHVSWVTLIVSNFSLWKLEALVTQSCLILCDSIDCNPPGSSVHEILQSRMLEWVAISFSRGSFWPRNRTRLSCIAGRFFINWTTREAHFSL